MISRCWALWVFSLLLVAQAAAPAPFGSARATAKPGGGQRGLVVGFTPEGQLRACVYAGEPCSLERGASIAVPAEAARQAAGARLTIVPLGEDRKAVVVEIPDPSIGRAWTTIITAPLAGDAPLLPFTGYTGSTEGTEGERSGSVVLARDGHVYVGTQREGQDLCGRPAILGPKALDPKSLTLKPAKVQRLDDAERQAAPVLAARPSEGPRPPPLLHAVWATSAADGEPASALTDGSLETAWAESRGGAGRGELAVLLAPREVPLGALEIALAPRSAAHAAVPREVWIATDHQLFRVTLPDPGHGGARFEVGLPSPVTTGCIAVVLESASSDDAEAVVAIAEIAARPALGASPAELVQALPGGGAKAEAAAAVLRASGPEAHSAVAAAFAGLDEGGRRVALDVVDDAACEVALPVYIDALVGAFDAQRLHARRALERCRSGAGAAFAAALSRGSTKARAALAEELSSAAPATAVTVLVPLLATASAGERRAYRSAIGRAAQAGEAQARVVAALEDAALPSRAAIDLLRALGAELPTFGPAAQRAFTRLAVAPGPFRARFLMLGPAAALSQSYGSARAFLRSALSTDPDEHVRAEAARLLREPRPFYAELSRLLDDSAVRVREAALLALGGGAIDEAEAHIAYRLEHDPWPLVRSAAARALAGLGPGQGSDSALADALGDPSSEVRRAALFSIGARRATVDAGGVRERLDDKEEMVAVRAQAAMALGALCDAKAIPSLTEHAAKLALPIADEADRMIGRSALAALGVIAPSDLARRLAPLRAKSAPLAVRRLADATLATKGRCARPSVPVKGTGAQTPRR